MSDFLIFVSAQRDFGENVDDGGVYRFKVTSKQIYFRVADTDGNLIKEFSNPLHISTCTGPFVCPSRCYDLICFYNPTDDQPYLCNPSTERILRLPRVSRCKFFERPACGHLDFGHLASTNEYKFVHLFFTKCCGYYFEICCEVYSLSADANFDANNGAGSWRTIEGKCPYPTEGFAACVDEVLHWMPCDEVFDTRKDSLLSGKAYKPRAAVISFDLKTEVFRTMPATPPWEKGICKKGPGSGQLCGVGGKLVLFAPIQFSKNEVLKIGAWMVKDYEMGIWEKAYTIDLGCLESVAHFPREELKVYPIGYVGEDEFMVEISVFTGSDSVRRVAYYNMRTKSFRTMENLRGYARFGLFKKSVAAGAS